MGDGQTATTPVSDDWAAAAAQIAGNQAVAPTARNTPAQPSDGDDWQAAAQIAQRPIPAPIAPPKDPNVTDVGPATLTDPSFLKSVPAGFAKSAGQTISGVAGIANKVLPNAASNALGIPSWISPEMEQKEEFDKDVNTPEGLGEAAGGGLESIAEFMMGDEALVGLTHADKLLQAGRLAKVLETAPRASKAMELGMQAVRQGAVAGVQQYAHGASPADALTAAGIATVLGVPVGQITHWTPEIMDAIKMAQENKYVKTPADMLVRSINPPEDVDLGRNEAGQQDYAKFDKELKSNLPYIIGHIQETGEAPVGRRDFIDAIAQTSNKFRDAYLRVLNPVKDVEVSVLPKIPSYGGAVDKDTGMATLGQLDTRLNDINDLMHPKYEAGKGGLTAEAKVGSAPELRREAGAIRKLLYSELQTRQGDALGINVAETKARNGQLRDLADVAERRYQQARMKANTPLGDIAPTPARAMEQSLVRGKRNILGDPRDIETRTAWKMLEQRGDHGLQVGALGPEAPPPTNAFVDRTPAYINIPERPTDITWEKSTPEEIAAQKAKIANRANVVKGAREQAAKKVEKNRASHTPTRGAEEQSLIPPAKP